MTPARAQSSVLVAPLVALATAALTLLAACPQIPSSAPGPRGPGNIEEPGPTNPPDPPDPPDPEPFAPADARMRRLLSWQYQNAVRDILGDAAANTIDPPADIPLNGFVSVGSASLSLSPVDIEKLELSAYAAAQSAVHGDAAQSWRVCTPTAHDDGVCAAQVVASIGRRLFRRPLTAGGEDDELVRWTTIATQAANAYGDFDMGLEFAIAGMLQSPHFIYLVEVGVPVDASEAAALVPGARRLSGLEMAARLSFFLVGTTPSDALLDAAAAGELDSREGVRIWAQALVEQPLAQDALRRFFDEKLGLALLPSLSRTGGGFNSAIKAAMREETLRFINDVIWTRNADARELFTSDATFVNDELAGFYGLPLPGLGSEFVRITLAPTTRRAGLFTQGAFLSRFAHESRSAPTQRGKFIRESVLCQAVPAPPDDVNTVLPEPTADDLPRTTRERMDAHVADESCAACHLSMDPLGFAYEEFDQAGRYRTHEEGLPIDAATDIDGVPVNGAADMARALAQFPEVPACLVKNLFRHGTGHLEELAEDPSLALVADAFEDSGFRLKDALIQIALSDAFRLIARPQGAP